MSDDKEYSWFMTFISIVFGVLVSVWVQPLGSVLADNNPQHPVDFLDWARGGLMLLVLISLWYWCHSCPN